MATLGWIKVGVSADISQFTKQMQSASKATHGFGSHVKNRGDSGVLDAHGNDIGGYAHTGELSKGMAAAAEETKRFDSSVRSLAGAFVAFEAAKAAFQVVKAGVGTMASFVKGSMDTINSTRLMAERLGTSTQALSELQYAAKLSDVDNEALTGGLEKLNVKLAEVATGAGGPAAEALRKLGLNAATLAGEDKVQAFQEIAAAMDRIPNPAQKAAISVDLFGKAGQGLSGLLAQGSAGINQMRQEARDVGAAFNDVSAAKVDEADDALTRAWATVGGFGNSIATELAPFITLAADKFTEFGVSAAKGGSFASQAMDWVVSGLGLATDGANFLKASFYAINASIAEMVSFFLAGVDKMLSGVDWLVEKVTGSKTALGGTLKSWSEAFETTAVEELGKAEKAWQQIGKGHATVRTLVNDIQESAQQRAEVAAKKSADFRAPGAPLAQKPDVKFSGAMELGSKEAYSTILRARTQTSNMNEQRKIVANTERIAQGIDRLGQTMGHTHRELKGRKPLSPPIPIF